MIIGGVYKTLFGVSHMVDQGRIILQNFGLCKLSIQVGQLSVSLSSPSLWSFMFILTPLDANDPQWCIIKKKMLLLYQ